MVGLRDEHEAKQILTTAAHEFLTALSELSAEKIFQHEEDEGEKPLRPASAQQIAAEESEGEDRVRRKLRRCENFALRGAPARGCGFARVSGATGARKG